MDLEEYQRQCRAFDNHEPGLAPLVLGLVSEAGEIAAELEKAARQDHTRRSEAQLRQRMLEEAGCARLVSNRIGFLAGLPAC